MVKRERHQFIIDKVEREGRVLTKELVKELNLAEDTVRKDFQELSAQGKVQRFHGGILKLADKPNKTIDFDERILDQVSIKQELSEAAVKYIKNKHVLFIDGGTTNLKFAEKIPFEFIGTVITNAPNIAVALCNHPNIEIVVIGGILNKMSNVITGSKAIEQIQEMNIECCILDVSSISEEYGITYHLSDEAILKREIINHSRQIIVIANKRKLGSISTFKAADASVIDVLITDEDDEEIIQKYRSLNIELVSVGISI